MNYLYQIYVLVLCFYVRRALLDSRYISTAVVCLSVQFAGPEVLLICILMLRPIGSRQICTLEPKSKKKIFLIVSENNSSQSLRCNFEF